MEQVSQSRSADPTDAAAPRGWPHDFPPGPVLRRVEDLHPEKIKSETAYRIAGARLLFANYELLRHDFPHLSSARLAARRPELSRLGPAEREAAERRLIDHWLEANTTFISGKQAGQSLVNSRIPLGKARVMGFRPSGYGRATVFCLRINQRGFHGPGAEGAVSGPEGLLDVKGTGVWSWSTPNFRQHGNGLLTLNEAICEILFQELIGKVLRRYGNPFWTLPFYAVLDLGFEVRKESGETSLAASLVRRAHRRPLYRRGLQRPHEPTVAAEMSAELLLRRYGITSCGYPTIIYIYHDGERIAARQGPRTVHYRGDELRNILDCARWAGDDIRLDGMNMQFTREVLSEPPRPQILDFGAYRVEPRFEHRIVSMTSANRLHIGEVILPEDPRFVQTDDRVRIRENPRVLADDLARDYRAGRKAGADVRRAIDRFIETVTGSGEGAE